MKTNLRNRRSSRKTKKSLRVPRKFAALRDAIVPILEPYGVKRIKSYLCGVNEKKFKYDLMRQDAVMLQIEILGEAARHISKEFQE